MNVRLGTQNRMYLYSDRETMVFLTASALRSEASGFRIGQKSIFQVRYGNEGMAYHQYEGGDTWMATVPQGFGKPGQQLRIEVRMLTRNAFVDAVPKFSLANEIGFGWLPNFVTISKFSLDSGFHFEAFQEPAVEGIDSFSVDGIASDTLGFVPGYGCYLQFRVLDWFKRDRVLRIYHNGHSRPLLGLGRSKKFPRISFISHDGIRLKVVYNSPQRSVMTIYSADPSSIYKIESGDRRSTSLRTHFGAIDSYQIELSRNVEHEMLASKYRYPHARLGAEVAYSIASKEIDIKDVILRDPSEGGADLMSLDGKTVVEARFIAVTDAFRERVKIRQIEFQSSQLKARLKSDLAFYEWARSGYAVLSFLDSSAIRVLVFKMEKES
ncbi:MAG TPA: hypothetical protein VGR53_10190 [Nitrososphaerales archaeon]|nr:hypothetical protein [Nitrososphaerales archaeon]